MKLYIVRHGLAGEHGDPKYADDRLRPLTDEGRKRFAATVQSLAKSGVDPKFIASSPLIRCRQTAEILVENLPGRPKLIELDALAPGSDLPAMIEWTNRMSGSDVAWVGHAPDVSDMVSKLTGLDAANVRFAKGAVAAIEFDDEVESGRGELCWLVTAKVLGH